MALSVAELKKRAQLYKGTDDNQPIEPTKKIELVPQPPSHDPHTDIDTEAKKAGLLVGASGEVYERQLSKSHHLFIELIDGEFVCYWRRYDQSETPTKEKNIARGAWRFVFSKAKTEISWWTNRTQATQQAEQEEAEEPTEKTQQETSRHVTHIQTSLNV